VPDAAGPAEHALAAPIRVVVVDDHRIFRAGLRALLDAEPTTEAVGEAGDGDEAIAVVRSAQPDVVLMDITMPGTNGIEATRRLHREHPQVRVVMLTMLEDDDSLFAALCAGARGYLLKGADTAEVVRTVRAAAAGDALFGAEMAERLTGFFRHAEGRGVSMAPFPQLTDREREILALIADGHDNAAIARRMYIAPKTVSNNVSNILAKLQLRDRAQAIVAAREAGLGSAGGEPRE
jgi:DNA-binding NarL/FixJ family response regulator